MLLCIVVLEHQDTADRFLMVLTLQEKYFSVLMSTAQLPGEAGCDKYMTIHTSTLNKFICLERKFQKHLFDSSRKNDVMDQGK